MNIYVYRQGDTVFADTEQPPNGELIRILRVNSRSAARALHSSPGEHLPQRIRALIERMEPDLPASGMARPFGPSLSGS